VIQGKNVQKFKCDGCSNAFCNRTWLVQHQSNCVDFQKLPLLKEIEDLKYQIEQLQQTITYLAEKAMTTPTVKLLPILK
jgi:hypothetical protein